MEKSTNKKTTFFQLMAIHNKFLPFCVFFLTFGILEIIYRVEVKSFFQEAIKDGDYLALVPMTFISLGFPAMGIYLIFFMRKFWIKIRNQEDNDSKATWN